MPGQVEYEIPMEEAAYAAVDADRVYMIPTDPADSAYGFVGTSTDEPEYDMAAGADEPDYDMATGGDEPDYDMADPGEHPGEAVYDLGTMVFEHEANV